MFWQIYEKKTVIPKEGGLSHSMAYSNRLIAAKIVKIRDLTQFFRLFRNEGSEVYDLGAGLGPALRTGCSEGFGDML